MDRRHYYVQALLREREGYVAKGRQDRMADVDAELARLGHQVAEAPKAPPAGVAPETTEATPLPERATPPRPRRPGR